MCASYTAIQQVAQVANMLQSTAAASERVFEFLDEEEEEILYDDLEEELRPFIAKDIKESLRKAENELQGSTGIDLNDVLFCF